jgi:hypothetical protein
VLRHVDGRLGKPYNRPVIVRKGAIGMRMRLKMPVQAGGMVAVGLVQMRGRDGRRPHHRYADQYVQHGTQTSRHERIIVNADS